MCIFTNLIVIVSLNQNITRIRACPIRETSNHIKTNGVDDETLVLRNKIHNVV